MSMDDMKPRCPGRQVGWNQRDKGMGADNYKVVTTTDADGCVTKTITYTGAENPDSPVITVIGDEDCFKPDAGEMLMQSGHDRVGSNVGDVLMVDC